MARARKVVAGQWGLKDSATVDKLAHALAAHGKTCSCFACGNPRRYFDEPTIQEKKAPTE